MEKNLQAKQNLPRIWDAAVVVKDLEKARQRVQELGIGQFVQGHPPAGAEGLFYHGKPSVSNFKAFIVQIGNMQLEFIQPGDEPNPWTEFLNTRGEGIHHIGFQVKDVEKEANRLISLGAEVPFYGKIKGKMGAAYVDLKVANLVLELTSFCDIT
ncbi:MAG: VOC family protein [Dehalococcoidales bacterium]|jgi:hypothetical protein